MCLCLNRVECVMCSGVINCMRSLHHVDTSTVSLKDVCVSISQKFRAHSECERGTKASHARLINGLSSRPAAYIQRSSLWSCETIKRVRGNYFSSCERRRVLLHFSAFSGSYSSVQKHRRLRGNTQCALALLL